MTTPKRKTLSVEIACPFCPEKAGVTMIGEARAAPHEQRQLAPLVFLHKKHHSLGWRSVGLECIACGGRMAVDVYAAPKPKGRKK